jgi:hypothetical protein
MIPTWLHALSIAMLIHDADCDAGRLRDRVPRQLVVAEGRAQGKDVAVRWDCLHASSALEWRDGSAGVRRHASAVRQDGENCVIHATRFSMLYGQTLLQRVLSRCAS